MNAVDKLREMARQYDGLGVLCGNLNAIADEIERDYMELPKDADGVPIRVGDKMDEDGCTVTVRAVAGNYFVDDMGYDNEAAACRHRHAPTVEDMLRKFIGDACVYTNETIAEYAERLREVLADE